MDKKEITGRILNLTLEIICLLSGEDYMIVKKTSDDSHHYETPIIHPHEEKWILGNDWSQNATTQLPLHTPIHEKKILEIANKITELLTGEVSLRCQDVAVYFSLEEWDYIEEHRDLYLDVVMEEHRAGTAPENSAQSSEGNFILLLNYKEDEDTVEHSSGENLSAFNVYPEIHSTDLSYNSYNHEEPTPEQLQIVLPNTHMKEGKPFQCDECGKQFTKSSSFLSHRRMYRGEKPYSCSECGKCFRDKSSLVRHERTHTGEKPYSCSECGKCFVQKSDLVKHQRSHTGEKLYPCSQCGKSFISKSNLVTHQRIHTGERLFQCSECGKCFTSKSNLLRHDKSHTGERPFLCSECGKCFITKSKLQDHHRCHTGEKPYACSECGKCFSTKAKLGDHQRIHTGEMLY
ncbi:uncharacterized protein LOC142303084 isoform X2 [Anomaloglossus baeobatrachus]